MGQRPGDKNRPKSLSPTPLRDWISRQNSSRRAGLVVLFALLIACGGQAGVSLGFTPVPATHQVLFVMLAGALLGSRLGTVATLCYLVSAAATGRLWPVGWNATALIGPLSGYLWSLPLVAYLSGFFVERARAETPVFFAIGVSAAIGVFDAIGSVRLLAAQELGASEAFVKGAGFFVGQHLAQGALTVLVATSASATIRSREEK